MIAGIASAMLIILTAAPAYASMLKGVVVANKLAGGGLDNVEVTVDEAAGNSTITKDGGKFAFAFPEKHAGEIVHVRVSLKEGYAIVNDFQLECTILADPDAKLLTIIVCREVDREELARFFYRLKSDEAIEATYQKKLKALEEAHQTDLEAAAKLKEERDQAKAAAEKYSLELAKDQPGRSSELYQQARRLFVEGKIDEAIALLDENKLRQLDEEAKKAVENAVQPRLLKAHLLTVQFRFDEAETAFIQAIAISPDGFEANFAYAGFTQNLNASINPGRLTAVAWNGREKPEGCRAGGNT